jgi:hypothetical protein
MKQLFSVVLLVSLMAVCSCKSVQEGSQGVNGPISLVHPTSMSKDAIRLQVKIERVIDNYPEERYFDVLVEKVIKYGAAFSSIEPKVGEVIRLKIPSDAAYGKGEILIIDVLTPRIDKGEKPMTVQIG